MTWTQRFGEYLRNNLRNLLALLLALGTAAGTIWTFSNGQLTLDDAMERLFSVGGVALALELGVIYIAKHIGDLDQRVHTARRKEDAVEYARQRKDLIYWFYAVLAISVAANVYFRYYQLDNFLLALFVGIAPAPLIILFAIKLRPLTPDYNALARAATEEGLIRMVKTSSRVFVLGMERLGSGAALSEAEMESLRMSAGVMTMFAQRPEQRALEAALSPAGSASTAAIPGDETWYSAKDVASMYHIPVRTAQFWVSNTNPRRKRADNRTWEVPASILFAQRGVPGVVVEAVTASSSTAQGASQGNTSTQTDASNAPLAEAYAIVPAQYNGRTPLV